MRGPQTRELRRGWTTGACATAATRAALIRLWTGGFPDSVSLILPRGETPVWTLAHRDAGEGWAEAGIVKDAGDDPDVTHGCLVIARVRPLAPGGGVVFRAGPGVGSVTREGLPVAVGEPAVNPVPRQMMRAEVESLAAEYGEAPDIEITLSIPGGETIALKTWNPRLGIAGGLSVLGTTGVVRPFSCAAWIASIHRGIDVARAGGLVHVAGTTGAQSEAAVQRLYGLPDHAMLDMGDFVGGLVKYLCRHPVARLTIGGGLAKMTKLSQGARDLHSARSQVDFSRLAQVSGTPEVAKAQTVLHSYTIVGSPLARVIAQEAKRELDGMVLNTGIVVDVVVCDRAGVILARAG
ncbi:MAG: cobalt-precorrin-5B (C(1))-methyltransferase [Rhodobacterales bacterium]|nr:cobalt-precorrin-5B (C(1))-methyltransferase [Rhodobacterales bacterium]